MIPLAELLLGIGDLADLQDDVLDQDVVQIAKEHPGGIEQLLLLGVGGRLIQDVQVLEDAPHINAEIGELRHVRLHVDLGDRCR